MLAPARNRIARRYYATVRLPIDVCVGRTGLMRSRTSPQHPPIRRSLSGSNMPIADTAVGVNGVSPFSRVEFPCVPGVLDCAESSSRLRWRVHRPRPPRRPRFPGPCGVLSRSARQLRGSHPLRDRLAHRGRRCRTAQIAGARTFDQHGFDGLDDRIVTAKPGLLPGTAGNPALDIEGPGGLLCRCALSSRSS